MDTPIPFNLSPRERETLDAYIRCGCAKLVAREMNISSKTVESFMSKARAKLNVRTTLLAVLLWDRLQRQS